jgi:hypothetical protein
MFDNHTLDRDLRTALTLKADDLFFTVGGSRGQELRAAFLGVASFEGLACEAFDEVNGAAIDLAQFDIARQVRELACAVSGRSWGSTSGVPDTEYQRTENLDFLEHFVSSLPTVALGGLDATSVRNGALKTLYLTSLAWFDLVDAVADTFNDEPDLHLIELSQLALLSGRDLRTIRNFAGPSKPLRTTSDRRRRRTSGIADPAFVTVHTFDAIDWLRRRSFSFAAIDTAWVSQRLAEASKRATIARSLIMLALINFGPRNSIAAKLGCGEDRVRALEDERTPLTSDDEQRLHAVLGL